MHDEATRRRRFDRLVETYGRQIYAQAYARTKNADTANAVTADVVRALYRSVAAQEEGDLTQWVNELTARALNERELSEVLAQRAAPQVSVQGAAPAPAAAPKGNTVTVQPSEPAPAAPVQPVPAPDTPAPAPARRPRHEKRKKGSAWQLALGIALLLVSLWALAGLLMASGVLPRVDLGYTWVNTHIYPLF